VPRIQFVSCGDLVLVDEIAARSFKTVDSENYYGPMRDSTVLREWPKREA
jgi:hypothetical protein